MTSGNHLPQDKYNLTSPEVITNPYPTYRRLLLEEPVYWCETLNGWYLTRYQDVAMGLQDPRLSAQRFSFNQLPESSREKIRPFADTVSQWIMFLDPPNHTQLRTLLNKGFTPSIINGMTSRIQALVDELIDAVYDQGNMDVIRDLAYPLPVIIIAEMLGARVEDRNQLKKWTDELAKFFGSVSINLETIAPIQSVIIEMTEYFRCLLEERRKAPQNDLISSLIVAEEQQNVISEKEILSNCIYLTTAGNETTTNLIANGLLALLNNPHQMQKLKDNPANMATAIEEFLRYETPVQRFRRIAVEDIEIDGKLIRKGDTVFLFLGAANRDPAQFSEPDQLNITRKENPHLAFGKGTHFCIGASLGRLEGQIAIGTLLRRLHNLHLNTDKPEWRTNLMFRTLKSLPVAFTP